MPGGRPSSYTPELANEVCEQIAAGKSIRKLCLDNPNGPAARTIYQWLDANADFAQQYARAREQQADLYAAEIVEISDDSRNDTQSDDEGVVLVNHDEIARARLRVDARKWAASKLAPKKYGDKIAAEIAGAGGGPLVISWLTGPEPQPDGE